MGPCSRPFDGCTLRVAAAQGRHSPRQESSPAQRTDAGASRGDSLHLRRTRSADPGPPMSEQTDIADGGVPRSDPEPFRTADGHLDQEWLERLRRLLADGATPEIVAAMAPLHAADTGDVLESLDAGERIALVTTLGPHFDYTALTEVDDV